MENRDKDKLNKNTNSMPEGDVNRNKTSDIGKDKSGSSAEFGQNIGRSEKPESEPSRKSGSSLKDVDLGRSSGSSDMSSSPGRKSGGSMGSSGNNEH